MEEERCLGPSKTTNETRFHTVSSPQGMLYIYTNYANLEAIQYKDNSPNELKINANVMEHHKAKFRLHSTYAHV